MQKRDLFMVFDVESLGLHGEAFSVGYVVMDEGRLVLAGYFWTRPDNANGTRAAFDWATQHVVPSINNYTWATYAAQCKTTREMREAFWEKWMFWKGQGAMLAADCAWPVEARFLAACVDDGSPDRDWQGPYPLIDVASVRLAAGLDPLATVERTEDELPVHHPLADARQSARLLMEALAITNAATA